MNTNYSLRELQLTEYEILKEFKRVCDANGLKYYLCDGTLLGAVRHKGFIPWDDDVDVMMPYSDYQKFLKTAPDELNTQLFLQNYITDPQDHQAFSKIRKNNTAMVLPNHRRWTAHQGIWIDIFPMVYVNSKFEFQFKRKLISFSNYLQVDTFILDNEPEYKQTLGVLYYPYCAYLKLHLSFRTKLHNALLNCVFSKKKGKYYSYIWGNMTHLYSSSLIEGESILLQFEDELFSVPCEFKKILEETYGDYMKFPPEDQRNGGHGNVIVDLKHSYENYIKGRHTENCEGVTL